jgi:hypothetical protein
MKLLNQTEMLSIVKGKNKAFMTRKINQQMKYGNYEIFQAIIAEDQYGPQLEVHLGESWGVFRVDRRTGEWERDYGPLYHEAQVLEIVKELAAKCEI